MKDGIRNIMNALKQKVEKGKKKVDLSCRKDNNRTSSEPQNDGILLCDIYSSISNLSGSFSNAILPDAILSCITYHIRIVAII